MKKRLRNKAQSTAEFAIVLGLVVAAVIGMQVYVKRGLNGRIKDVVDHTGAGGDIGGETLAWSGNQYEPYYSNSSASSSSNSDEYEDFAKDGSGTMNSTRTSTGNRKIETGWGARDVD